MSSTTHSETAAVRTSGFAVVPGVFAPDEMIDLNARLEARPLSRTRAGIRHVLQHPDVERIANDPRLMNLVRAILGPNALPFHATLFNKSRDANWLVAWHQDTALPLRERHDAQGWGPWSIKDGVTYAHAPASALEQVIAVRIHLDDSMESNGPLRVLGGTHARGHLSDDQIEQLSREVLPRSCTVERGGLVLMRPLLVHASSKSISSQTRRVLHIEYAAQTKFDGLELAFA